MIVVVFPTLVMMVEIVAIASVAAIAEVSEVARSGPYDRREENISG
jgi:hypothetical protein